METILINISARKMTVKAWSIQPSQIAMSDIGSISGVWVMSKPEDTRMAIMMKLLKVLLSLISVQRRRNAFSLSNIKKELTRILFQICIRREMSSTCFFCLLDLSLIAKSRRSLTVFKTLVVWCGISSMMSYISLFLRIISSLASSNSVFLVLVLLSNCS